MTKILVMIDDNGFKELAYKCIETMEHDEPGILFIHNGAYLPLLSPDKDKISEFQEKKIPMFGIFRDFVLRGIEEAFGDKIELVDYNEFINLIMDDYDKVVSFV
ncbi:MAG: DsrH/TusB family sulfur metabolism protein [Candidatus Helarchaeota archaeon]